MPINYDKYEVIIEDVFPCRFVMAKILPETK